MRTPVYTEVTYDDMCRRVIEDLEAFACADAWDTEIAWADPFQSVQPPGDPTPGDTGTA